MNQKAKYLIQACRPHTLFASIAPMLVATGALIDSGKVPWASLLLCYIVAISAQIASNLANDYFDFLKGSDTKKRIGFERLLTKGKLAPRDILLLLIGVLLVTLTAGLLLYAWHGWWVLALGAAVLLFSIAYSSGPIPLAYHGLGDLAVVLFFGLAPILGTFYTSGTTPPLYLIWVALGVGLWSANILVCNNYRDLSEDAQTGKKTLIVQMGKRSGPILYLINALFSLFFITLGLLTRGYRGGGVVTLLVLTFFYAIGYFAIRRLEQKRLNALLIYTSRIAVLGGVLIMLSLIISL